MTDQYAMTLEVKESVCAVLLKGLSLISCNSAAVNPIATQEEIYIYWKSMRVQKQLQ